MHDRAVGTCRRHTRARLGGDTLNTAVYMARLGVDIDYLTVLGDDAWSEDMIAAWRTEGVGTGLVQRLPGRLPGLYVIQTDAKGERRFSYWRDHAPARTLFDRPLHANSAKPSPAAISFICRALRYRSMERAAG